MKKILQIKFTKNNKVWKICAGLLFVLLQHFFVRAKLHRVHKNVCYRKVQPIICAT